MTQQQIKEELSKYTNFVELFAKANELKRNGEKPTTVNKVVTELRKKLTTAPQAIKHMVKIPVPTLIEEPVIPYVNVVVENLNKPVIVFDNNGNILI